MRDPYRLTPAEHRAYESGEWLFGESDEDEGAIRHPGPTTEAAPRPIERPEGSRPSGLLFW